MPEPRRPLAPLLFIALALWAPAPLLWGDFVNFETPQVHPVDLGPDGETLAVCNTADNRLELFSVATGSPVPLGSIPVGAEPVSARFRTATEVWVVNQISDSVSVVELGRWAVVRTLATGDEPADVVFAGTPARAFVSCSQADTLQVFDPADLSAPPAEVPLEGEDPRALAVSPDGGTVYVAIFESGNATTILAGGGEDGDVIAFPPNVVSDRRGPWGGQNPPPNHGDSFLPEIRPGLPPPPPVGLIVKHGSDGRWRDDNGGDWTDLVSGSVAAASGRPVGWELVDNDVAVVDADTLELSYIEGLMNICMALAVNPSSGAVAVVGTEATNEVRFEPVVNGTFVRVNLALADPAAAAGADPSVVDLNPHLDYSVHTLPQAERDRSLGDPRGIAWDAAGERAFITGMGSNNLVVVDAAGTRAGPERPIELGEGPTGLAYDPARGRLYVLNRFAASVSAVDIEAGEEVARVPFFDPSPEAIKRGRRHLYDTHATSGLGQVSCASCHVDARMDRLAWDLGDPAGEVDELGREHNLGASFPGISNPGDFSDFHPMKGPMTTQTLQDIIGKEPHHWRGDRDGLESFNPAFVGLLGDDVELTAAEMQEFEDFLATIYFPPNPFRGIDNSLPEDLPLDGHFTTGRFGPAGRPMPNGNARRALEETYRPLSRGIDRGALACVTCHTLPTGIGTDSTFGFGGFDPIDPGPMGERHHALVSVDGSSQTAFKVPQVRNVYDKSGFDMTQARSRAGFGFLHDGSVDSITRFLSEPAFLPDNLQEIADMVALMLAFSGSDFGGTGDAFEPPGSPSQDAHAAVGKQVTLEGPGGDRALLDTLLGLADNGVVDVVAKSSLGGRVRGWAYLGGGRLRVDQAGLQTRVDDLLAAAAAPGGAPVTFTVVPAGTGQRAGIDRDRDGLFDFDEVRDLAPELVGHQNPFDPAIADATGDAGSTAPDGVPDGQNDFDGDGVSNADELAAGTDPAGHLSAGAGLRAGFGADRATGRFTLTWTMVPGEVYQVEYTGDLATAWTAAPAGRFTAGPGAPTDVSWTDEGAAGLGQRYYRLRQVVADPAE